MSPIRAPAWRERWAAHAGVDAAAATAFLLFCGLSFKSRQPEQVNVWLFLAILFGAWAAVLGAYFSAPSQTTAGLGTRILAWAIAFRLAGLLAHPVLEDDYHRYLWDGRVFALSGNPYHQAPANYFQDTTVPRRFQEVLDNVNHPDAPTIYGPVCELSFLIGYWLSPGDLMPLKIFFIVAELLTIRWLLKLASPRNVMLYAWCPLAVTETSFNAHPDALGVCFMIGALCLARSPSPMMSAVAAAVAAGARVFAILLAPFLLVRARWGQWAVMAGSLMLLYLPFASRGSIGELKDLRQFAAGWEFNSFAFAGLAHFLGYDSARIAAALVFAVGYCSYFVWWRRKQTRESVPRGDLIYACFFLLSPVVNPWYLLWLAPFIAITPSATGVTALAVVSLSYLHGLNLPGSTLAAYEHPIWVRWLEVGALVAALGYDLRHRRRAP